MSVYLAGRIKGCTDVECREWRETAKGLIEDTCLDPMRRDYRDTAALHYKEIVELDKQDILQSKVVLVYYDGIPSVGTSMEILFAWANHIPVVLVASEDIQDFSPWMIYHSSIRFTNLYSAAEYINHWFRPMRKPEY